MRELPPKVGEGESGTVRFSLTYRMRMSLMPQAPSAIASQCHLLEMQSISTGGRLLYRPISACVSVCGRGWPELAMPTRDVPHRAGFAHVPSADGVRQNYTNAAAYSPAIRRASSMCSATFSAPSAAINPAFSMAFLGSSCTCARIRRMPCARQAESSSVRFSMAVAST